MAQNTDALAASASAVLERHFEDFSARYSALQADWLPSSPDSLRSTWQGFDASDLRSWLASVASGDAREGILDHWSDLRAAEPPAIATVLGALTRNLALLGTLQQIVPAPDRILEVAQALDLLLWKSLALALEKTGPRAYPVDPVVRERAQTLMLAQSLVESEVGRLDAGGAQLETHELVNRLQEAAVKLAETNLGFQELDRTKVFFLGTVAHELRAPLSAAIAFGASLREEAAGPLNTSQRHVLDELLRCLEQCGVLQDDLLDLASFQTGKFSLLSRSFDFRRLAERVVDTFESIAARKGLTLAMDGPAEMEAIVGDDRRLYQILFNLVDNAIKFSSQGTVVVRFRREAGGLACEVEDEGVGIPENQADEIFKPFGRLQNSPGVRGTGLGLAISKALTEAHGGSMGYRCKDGPGVVFWFTVPAQGDRL